MKFRLKLFGRSSLDFVKEASTYINKILEDDSLDHTEKSRLMDQEMKRQEAKHRQWQFQCTKIRYHVCMVALAIYMHGVYWNSLIVRPSPSLFITIMRCGTVMLWVGNVLLYLRIIKFRLNKREELFLESI